MDPRLIEYLENDTKKFEEGTLTYLEAWEVIGHAEAAKFILPFYTDSLFYNEENKEQLDNYEKLCYQVKSEMGKPDSNISIYKHSDIASDNISSFPFDNFKNHFNCFNYFVHTFTTIEDATLHNLNDEGTFIKAFIQLVSDIVEHFDFDDLKNCVMKYGNNIDNLKQEKLTYLEDSVEELRNIADEILHHRLKIKTLNDYARDTGMFYYFTLDETTCGVVSKEDKKLFIKTFNFCKGKVLEGIIQKHVKNVESVDNTTFFISADLLDATIDPFVFGFFDTAEIFCHTQTELERIGAELYEKIKSDNPIIIYK